MALRVTLTYGGYANQIMPHLGTLQMLVAYPGSYVRPLLSHPPSHE